MNDRTTWLVLSMAAAAVATAVKTQAEALLQPTAEKVWPPKPGEKVLPGADSSGHPENMPPAEIARDAASAVGEQLSDDRAVQLQQGIHWATGIAFGVGYGVAARRWPRLSSAGGLFGVPAGLALYAGTHASTLPALGLQPPPWRMPAAAVAWEAGSHAAYGAVLGAAAALGRRLQCSTVND